MKGMSVSGRQGTKVISYICLWCTPIYTNKEPVYSRGDLGPSRVMDMYDESTRSRTNLLGQIRPH